MRTKRCRSGNVKYNYSPLIFMMWIPSEYNWVPSSCLCGSINAGSSLFNHVHLEWLSLSDNDFYLSKIPSGILNLSQLSHLNPSSSSFSGQISSEIVELSKFVSLDLSGNLFLKLQKTSLQNLAEDLTNLELFNLNEVNISSCIPHSSANLSSLTYFSLEACRSLGEVPVTIFQIPNVYFLNVRFNLKLTGYFTRI